MSQADAPMREARTAVRPRQWLALGAIAGPVLLTAAWFVLGFMSPGYTLWGTPIAPYSPVSQPLSGLGMGPTAFMNAAFVLSGVMMIGGSIGVFQAIPELSSRARLACTGLLALPGLGAIVDGFFNLEHFFLHFAGFALALTTVVGFPIVGLLLRRFASWHGFGNWLVVAGPVTLALTVLYFVTFTPTVEGIQTGVAGLTERILVIELEAWYVALGWLAFRRS
jgi:hypothetical protein